MLRARLISILATAVTLTPLVAARLGRGQERVYTESTARELSLFADGGDTAGAMARLPDPLPPLPLDGPEARGGQDPLEPDVLRRPLDPEILPPQQLREVYESGPLLQQWSDAPLGYTGPSGVIPTEIQESSHF